MTFLWSLRSKVSLFWRVLTGLGRGVSPALSALLELNDYVIIVAYDYFGEALYMGLLPEQPPSQKSKAFC